MSETNEAVMRHEIDQIIQYAKTCFDCRAHDYDHTLRVLNNVKRLSQGLNVNMDVLVPAVYLHDIARAQMDKANKGACHALEGSKMAKNFLLAIHYPLNLIDPICHCIESHSFKGQFTCKTIEAKLLFDADKLDGLGAVGIARLYAMTGRYGEGLFGVTEGFVSPEIEFERKQQMISEYFYLEVSKRQALDRLAFMKVFFDKLKSEV